MVISRQLGNQLRVHHSKHLPAHVLSPVKVRVTCGSTDAISQSPVEACHQDGDSTSTGESVSCTSFQAPCNPSYRRQGSTDMWKYGCKFPVTSRSVFPSTRNLSRAFGNVQQSASTAQVRRHVDKFRIIAAMSRNGVIGIDGSIPWHLPDDRRLFQQLTNQSILIIGRRTFQEDPKLDHINHAQYCIVVSQSMTDINSYKEHCPNTTLGLPPSFSDALTSATTIRQQRKLQDHLKESSDLGCWIAGGEGLYREALLHESAFQLHLSIVIVDINVQGRSRDEFAMLPSQDLWGDRFEKVAYAPYSQNGNAPSFSYHVYQKKGQV